MIAAQEIRQGVECFFESVSPGIYFTVSNIGPKPLMRHYIGAAHEGAAVASAQMFWLFNDKIELYRDNGAKKRPKRIRNYYCSSVLTELYN